MQHPPPHFGHAHQPPPLAQQHHPIAAAGYAPPILPPPGMPSALVAVCAAAQNGDLRGLKHFIEHDRGNPNALLERGYSLLYKAARNGHTQLVRYLIDVARADVHLPCGESSSTALHAACYGGHDRVAMLLIARGADAYRRNNYHETPLMNASSPHVDAPPESAQRCVAILQRPTADIVAAVATDPELCPTLARSVSDGSFEDTSPTGPSASAAQQRAALRDKAENLRKVNIADCIVAYKELMQMENDVLDAESEERLATIRALASAFYAARNETAATMLLEEQNALLPSRCKSDAGRVTVFRELACAFCDIRRYQRCIEILHQAIALQRANFGVISLPLFQLYRRAGFAHVALQEYDHAVAAFEAATHLWERHTATPMLGPLSGEYKSTLLNLADAYKRLERNLDHDSVKKLLEEARQADMAAAANQASAQPTIVVPRDDPNTSTEELTPLQTSSTATGTPTGTPSRYAIGQQIGSGGFGTVYVANDRVDSIKLAAKALPYAKEKEKKQAEQEITLLKNLCHEHIVQIKGVEVRQKYIIIFMEFMSQGSLDGREERMWEYRVRHFIRQALKGLAYLDSQGCIHRDIKPANMLLKSDGTLKLADFGLGKVEIQGATKHQASSTSGGGTPVYMAPEYIRGEKASHKSDIWAIGCTIYYLATAKHPWQHKHFDGIEQVFFTIGNACNDDTIPGPKHERHFPHESAADYAHLSPSLRRIMQRCWHADPKERPSADELLRDPYFSDSFDINDPRNGVETMEHFRSCLAAVAQAAIGDEAPSPDRGEVDMSQFP